MGYTLDNVKENGNYYLRSRVWGLGYIVPDNGKENGNYYVRFRV